MKTALYLRVSTDAQTTENQRLELERLAELRGWNIAHVYEDIESGATGRERPSLNRMIEDAKKRKFDRLVVWSADRLGRSTAHVATLMAELQGYGVEQYYYRQGIDTSTEYGRAMVQMAAVFAELEHGIIKKRIHAGLERARAQGKRLGRPPMDDNTKDAVIALKRDGKTMREIANTAGISIGAVHKVLSGASVN